MSEANKRARIEYLQGLVAERDATMADMHNLIHKLHNDCNAWSENYDEATGRLREEIRTVDRVWKALGITTYAGANGRAIFEIVAQQRAALFEILTYCEAEPQTPAQAVMAKLARDALGLAARGIQDGASMVTSQHNQTEAQ